MTGFLLDTNVVSEPNRPRPNPAVTAWLSQVDERRTFLSAMTLAETRKGIAKLGSDSRAARLEILLTGLRHRFQGRILPLDEDVLDRWGRLAGAAEARGVRLPVIDALFAATALHHNLVLVTRNVRDMAGTGVALFNPWDDHR